MPEQFVGTIDELVFNPKGSLDEAGLPMWLCAAHSRRKRFAELELGEVVFTVEQFRAQYPDGFRNSMAAVQACKQVVADLLAQGNLYYVT